MRDKAWTDVTITVSAFEINSSIVQEKLPSSTYQCDITLQNLESRFPKLHGELVLVFHYSKFLRLTARMTVKFWTHNIEEMALPHVIFH